MGIGEGKVWLIDEDKVPLKMGNITETLDMELYLMLKQMCS